MPLSSGDLNPRSRVQRVPPVDAAAVDPTEADVNEIEIAPVLIVDNEHWRRLEEAERLMREELAELLTPETMARLEQAEQDFACRVLFGDGA